MYLFIFNLFSWIKGREREKAHSPPAMRPKAHICLPFQLLSLFLWPFFQPQPLCNLTILSGMQQFLLNFPFPLQSLPTGYPAHSAQVSPTRPLTQLSQSLNFARALKLQEKHDGHSQCQAVGEFLFTHSLPSAWPGGREQSLCGCIINHKASVSQLFIKG